MVVTVIVENFIFNLKNMTSLHAYRAFQSRRKLTTRIGDKHEKLDQIEKGLYVKALAEMNLITDEAHMERFTRRNKIFRAFSARDYLNPITRSSIVEALANAK